MEQDCVPGKRNMKHGGMRAYPEERLCTRAGKKAAIAKPREKSLGESQRPHTLVLAFQPPAQEAAVIDLTLSSPYAATPIPACSSRTSIYHFISFVFMATH